MIKTSLRVFETGFMKKSVQKHPICLTNSDYDYILYEIKCQDKIDFEGNVSGNNDVE